ncbi:MAG: hypothetical protein ABSE77_14365 [Acidimicrobiales bacterium]
MDRTQGWRGPARRTMVAAVAIGLITTPSIAAGSPRLASHTALLAKPALCAAVSPEAIAKVLGYRVPAATVSTGSFTFDQGRNVSVFRTTCSYGTVGTATGVGIVYERLSKPLPVSTIYQDIKASALANKPSGATYTITPYSELGVPGLYEQSRGSLTLEAVLGIQGEKIVGDVVGKVVPKSKVAALTKMAMANYF